MSRSSVSLDHWPEEVGTLTEGQDYVSVGEECGCEQGSCFKSGNF